MQVTGIKKVKNGQSEVERKSETGKLMHGKLLNKSMEEAESEVIAEEL